MLASRCRGTTAALSRGTRTALRTGAALRTGVLERTRSSWVDGWSLPLALVGLLIVGSSSGCRSGSAAFSAPKWWSFGGGKAESTFASAPTPGKDAAGDLVKPSSTATPYPTTSTPGAYNLAGAGTTPATASPAAAAPASAVTYGTTPPPAVAPAAPAVVASATPAATPAQVGPYSMLPAASPTPAPSSALAPAPAVAAGEPAAFPETAGYEPASRFAAAPAAGAAAAPVAGSRYAAAPAAATVEGSPGRYADVPAAAVASGSAAEGPAASRYAAASGSRFGPPTDAPASFTPAPPPPAAPVAAPLGAPAVPAASQPAGPTDPARSIRRPDPGYRPAGTSSYRPSGALLADGPPAPQPGAPADVQSAAFETEALPPRDE
jgi:hypothetical protein